MCLYERIETCRACNSDRLVQLHDFGETPLADRLVRPGTPVKDEPHAPLVLVLCQDCSLVQISVSVDPEVLFGGDYLYLSSVSPSLLRHFSGSARNIIAREDLGANSFVFEIASNDGYMLQVFKEAGIRVLGVDPAEAPSSTAISAGIPTIQNFFGAELAKQIASDHGRADVVLANNVLAHVRDLQGLVTGIATMLKPSGVAVIECPYVLDLVDGGEFDTIYHQHLCYFSVTALSQLFASHELELVDVERTKIHGGSLRLSVGHHGAVEISPNVGQMLELEAGRQITSPAAYAKLFELCEGIRQELVPTIRRLRNEGASVAAYGAAAKATTLLAYCGLEAEDIGFIADLNERKQGWLMPGATLPIVSPAEIEQRRPDYLLILAWNFADEIMAQQSAHAERGGRFIIPTPSVRIV